MRRAVAAAVAVALCAAANPGRTASPAEPVPAQGTRLRFQKTLFIHQTPQGRIFAETLQVERESSLLQILETDYGVIDEAMPPLLEAFRTLNPGMDPDHIPARRTVRVPFKMEETQVVARPSSSPPAPQTYTVKKGDSLWRVLKNRYKVAREEMEKTLAAVAKANPGIRDLNHLVAGQMLTIPGATAGTPVAEPARGLTDGSAKTILSLLEVLGCRVTSTGEAFLPLARGRTLRLDSREFPIVAGPTGRKVILDGSSRLSPALARSLEQSWNYTVVQGMETNAGARLENLLPRLGFHELTEGAKALAVATGVELVADTRWVVVPREEDLWEGRVHLLFQDGPPVGADLASFAVRAGYSVHVLSGGNLPGKQKSSSTLTHIRVPELSMADLPVGEGALLGALGVSHRVRPEVECDLGGGVRYRLRPEVTFDHSGTKYAIVPQEPRRAEELLSRAGFFTVTLSAPSSPLNRLGDLLSLLGVTPTRTVVEVPKGQALRLRLEGISFEHRGLAARLYPNAPPRAGVRILLTRAEVSPDAAAILVREGFLPWVVRAPEAVAAPPR